jgi:hypothetical protein
MRWIDTTIRDLIRWIDTTITTRGGSRTPGWHHDHDSRRGWHTNRVSWRAILVSHLAISCRDPNRFEPR